MPRTSTKSALPTAPASSASGTPPQERHVTSTTDGTGQPQVARMNQIARRAHEIYEARGGNHGRALKDWLQAEREIDEAMGTTDA